MLSRSSIVRLLRPQKDHLRSTRTVLKRSLHASTSQLSFPKTINHPIKKSFHSNTKQSFASPVEFIANQPSEHPIVRIDSTTRKIGITWSSGVESQYHGIWLRDHCRCANCYHQITKQRQLETFKIPLDVMPITAEATTEGLLVHWSQDQLANSSSISSSSLAEEEELHPSLYPWSWLYEHSYNPPTNISLTSNLIMWGSGIAQQPPQVSYEEVMSLEKGVAKWLNKIYQFGFCFVSGVPVTPEDTEKLINRITFIKETHYGKFWDFTSDLSHGDTAYTSLALNGHNDTTYFTDMAGLQMFHLLDHKGEGGESLLIDGFFCAKILKEVHPEAYEVLSRVRISAHSAGDDSTLIKPIQSRGYPIFEHDSGTGQLLRVRYNNDDRSVLKIDDKDVLPFYDALGKWNEILNHKDSEFWQQLIPGMPLIFDNNRVLHGRSSFTGSRRLCGAYINGDDYRSRLNVLQKRFSQNELDKIDNNDGILRRRGVWDDGI